MTLWIYQLCCITTFLLLCTTNAQLIFGYIPPMYNVPKYVNQGLKSYRQTRKLAQTAQNIGLPVQQTEKLVTNVALPLIPPAKKFAAKADRSLLPPSQRLSNTVGLSLVPKPLPGGIPVLPKSPASLTTSQKLLLKSNPLIPRISPLKIRSIDTDITTDKENTDASINPINEVSDDDAKEVIGASGSLANETTTDKLNQKTSDVKENVDEFDYLTQAANPTDEIETTNKNINQEPEHTLQQIDATISSNQTKQEGKESANSKESMPYKTWILNNENNNNGESKIKADCITEKMNEFRKVLNSGQYSQGSQFQLPKNIGSGLSSVMEEFQKSVLKASQKNNVGQKANLGWNPTAKLSEKVVDDTIYSDEHLNTHTELDQQKPSNSTDQNPDTSEINKENNELKEKNNPPEKQNNSSLKSSNNTANSMTITEKSDNEPEKYQMNNPIDSGNENLLTSDNMAWTKINADNSRSNQLYIPDNFDIQEPEMYQTLDPYSWNAESITGQDTLLYPNTRYYDNQRMLYPYLFNFGENYNQLDYPDDYSTWELANLVNPLIDNYSIQKSSNPLNADLSTLKIPYSAMYPILSRFYRQIPFAPSIPYQQFKPLQDYVTNFGTKQTLPLSLFKRSQLPDNIWKSANELAANIASISKDSGKVNTDKVLETTGQIFNAGYNLADDTVKFVMNPSTNNKYIQPQSQSKNNKDINTTDIDKTQDDKLISSSNENSNQDLEDKTVKAESDSTSNDNKDPLVSYGFPTYAGGFFPRSNSAGSIVTSAAHLASQILKAARNTGDIQKIPVLKSTPEIGNYAGSIPLEKILNSATKLAGDITNTAAIPRKFLWQ